MAPPSSRSLVAVALGASAPGEVPVAAPGAGAAARLSKQRRGSPITAIAALLGAASVVATALPAGGLHPWTAAFLAAGGRVLPGPRAPTPQRRAPRPARGGEGRTVEGDVQPLGSYVLVRLGKPEQKTQGGIVLPSRQKPNEGDVVAVGPGEWNDRTSSVMPVGIMPGRRVLYSKSAYFDKFVLKGVEHGLLREDDILLSFDAKAGSESKPPPPDASVLSVPRGRAVVRVDEQKRETDEGLLLSKGAAEEKGGTSTGFVVAVGESEVAGESPEVAAGDVVYFKYGEEVKLHSTGKEKYMSVRQSDCIAKVKPSTR